MQIATLNIQGQELELHPERVVYWKEGNALILSDLHLGKVSHFRRHGIQMPEAPSHHNFLRLQKVIRHYQPDEVYFLGDLFHSHANREFDTFVDFLAQHQKQRFHLVKGNHDILPRKLYERTSMQVHEAPFSIGPFQFHHHPVVEPPTRKKIISEMVTSSNEEPFPSENLTKSEIQEDAFHIVGHLHPGVVLRGNGRQVLKLRCFFCQPRQMILPAFGEFTGKATLDPSPGDQIYVIAEDEVVLFA